MIAHLLELACIAAVLYLIWEGKLSKMIAHVESLMDVVKKPREKG